MTDKRCTFAPPAVARKAFLDAAVAATALLRSEHVAAHWDAPSALDHYTIAGLAGHISGQIFFVRDALDEPPGRQSPVSLLDYYARVSWLTAGHEDAPHVAIRTGSRELAAAGPRALADAATAAVDRLANELTAAPAKALHLPGWGDWSVMFDDFVVTRTMELVVHTDDLAVSLGTEAPPVAATTAELVVDLLVRIALYRHGDLAVLRALSRAERAPRSIAAF